MNQRPFTISRPFIWISSLCIGVLAAIPKLLRLGLPVHELGVDISIASLFSVGVWYFNLYQLPRRQDLAASPGFFNRRLARSLLLGIPAILLLGGIHQWLFPGYHFASMIAMYEFRGLVINLTISLFLHLTYQQYLNQQVGNELEKVRADKLCAQLELLKQQVNPHFLFNSLNTLKSMVDMGDQNASEFIVRLSSFYRSALENRRKSLIPLSEEWEILDAYIFLLKARFEEGIRLEVDLRAEHRHSLIPIFTLQLLTENCIKHNVISLEQTLHIRIFSEGEYVVIANNIQPKRSVEHSTQTGLDNIRDRYRQLQQKEVITLREAGEFIVKLPVIHENSHY